MPDLVPVRRALLSVSDKTDLVPFARALESHGVSIVSTGGTAKALSDAGVRVTPIEQLTGFPEIMGGRVKTLHPVVHGGLLALRDDPDHAEAMRAHRIPPIDLVCVNLYPFEQTAARDGADLRDAVEQIDIGGPSMIRSAAKNHAYVAVVPSPRFYDKVASAMRANAGATPLALRRQLAAAAFARTAEYDAAIADFLSRRFAAADAASAADADAVFPEQLRIRYRKVEDLRYGENPHQRAAVYRDPSAAGQTVVGAPLLHGKQLSYNNLLDAAAALDLVHDLASTNPGRACAAVIKHTNACGSSVADSPEAAADLALLGDPLAAYGGILACSAPIDADAARRLTREGVFLEVIVAPSFTAEALDTLRNRWTAVRLLAVGERTPPAPGARPVDLRTIAGGALVQERDALAPAPDEWTHAAGPAPTPALRAQASTLWPIVKHLKSNAVAIGGASPERPGSVRLFGAGAGQMDRVASCRIAVEKAGPLAKGAIACSDAFFPFADGPEVLLNAGVTTLVHAGGSKRDQDTIDLCNRRGATCLLTGARHFRH